VNEEKTEKKKRAARAPRKYRVVQLIEPLCVSQDTNCVLHCGEFKDVAACVQNLADAGHTDGEFLIVGVLKHIKLTSKIVATDVKE
jgi:hypothetical protein